LAAGIYVDRESLLARNKVQVVIRPQLYLNGIPVTLSVLEDVRLVIVSTDLDGEGAHGTSGTIGKPDQLLLMFSKRSPSESLIA